MWIAQHMRKAGHQDLIAHLPTEARPAVCSVTGPPGDLIYAEIVPFNHPHDPACVHLGCFGPGDVFVKNINENIFWIADIHSDQDRLLCPCVCPMVNADPETLISVNRARLIAYVFFTELVKDPPFHGDPRIPIAPDPGVPVNAQIICRQIINLFL